MNNKKLADEKRKLDDIEKECSELKEELLAADAAWRRSQNAVNEQLDIVEQLEMEELDE